MTALDEPWRVIHEPGGYLLAPVGPEYIGDVMNVTFSNGWIADDSGDLCRERLAINVSDNILINDPQIGGMTSAIAILIPHW